MRNLAVCCDGTWNTPDQREAGVPVPTNVVRLFNALSDRDAAGNPQLKYYHPGVGTEGGWWKKTAGGMFGDGLSKNIMSAYRWLCDNYQADDLIFLFGFSRGAYTVRSLAGMISACGLLDLSGRNDDEAWARVETAYNKGYRNRAKCKSAWGKGWAFHGSPAQNFRLPLYFLGVWDTVGALGIPDNLAVLNLLDNTKHYAFHDTTLSDNVECARHAVALDEERASFTPTLWEKWAPGQDVAQVWFPGVHCDVGGGYLEKGLSDGALRWMMDEAAARGLIFDPRAAAQVTPNFQDVLHDSRTGIFKKLRTQPRSAPLIAAASGPDVHESALKRQQAPPIAQTPYRPTFVLAIGGSKPLPIYAVQQWNDTGIYLEAGTEYEFSAEGQWMDASIKCGPEGADHSGFQFGRWAHFVGSSIGALEKAYKEMRGNPSADFLFTKREESFPWLSLTGAIANGGNPQPDGTPAPHQMVSIGRCCRISVRKPGYFYCFANDAWGFYSNNRGCVTLTVKRLR